MAGRSTPRSASAEPCVQEVKDVGHRQPAGVVEVRSGITREPRAEKIEDVLDGQPAATSARTTMKRRMVSSCERGQVV